MQAQPGPQPQPAAPTPEDGTLKLQADLAVVFEDLLQCVRRAEANWRFDDLLDVRAAAEGWT